MPGTMMASNAPIRLVSQLTLTTHYSPAPRRYIYVPIRNRKAARPAKLWQAASSKEQSRPPHGAGREVLGAREMMDEPRGRKHSHERLFEMA